MDNCVYLCTVREDILGMTIKRKELSRNALSKKFNDLLVLSEITKIVKGKKKQATNKVKVHGKMEPKTNGFLITKKSQGIVSSNTELKEKANQKPEDIHEDKLVILLPSYLRKMKLISLNIIYF